MRLQERMKRMKHMNFRRVRLSEEIQEELRQFGLPAETHKYIGMVLKREEKVTKSKKSIAILIVPLVLLVGIVLADMYSEMVLVSMLSILSIVFIMEAIIQLKFSIPMLWNKKEVFQEFFETHAWVRRKALKTWSLTNSTLGIMKLIGVWFLLPALMVITLIYVDSQWALAFSILYLVALIMTKSLAVMSVRWCVNECHKSLR